MTQYATFVVYPRSVRPVSTVVMAVADDADITTEAEAWVRDLAERYSIPDGVLRIQMDGPVRRYRMDRKIQDALRATVADRRA